MFIYYNAEPNKELLSDCVIRAISLGLAIHYDKIVKLLAENGDFNSCEEICVDCYSKLLENFGLYKNNGHDRTVEEIAQSYPDDVVIIRINGHLTCSIDGNIYDTWDCSKEKCVYYWIVK